MARRRRSWSMNRYASIWPAYVPVAERRAQADKEVAALRKKRQDITPVVLSGTKIASTFWGKAWGENLESYSDYANRLPRGRSYLRSGSVVHLAIGENKIDALVRGTSMYTVTIGIASLAARRWSAVVAECAGKVGSLVELLQGKLSKGVMEVVTRREQGLFPTPKEIEFACSCPDSATMCKHVAAVMYGVGARLDEQPEILFRLRGVDPSELLSEATLGRAASARVATGRALAEGDLAVVFGIELDEGAITPTPAGAPQRAATASKPKPARPTKSGAAAKRATRPRETALVRVTVAELAAAGALVADLGEWIESGDLVPTRSSGVYQTSASTRVKLLRRSAGRG